MRQNTIFSYAFDDVGASSFFSVCDPSADRLMVQLTDIHVQPHLVSGIGADEVKIPQAIALHPESSVGNGFVDLLSRDHAIGR